MLKAFGKEKYAWAIDQAIDAGKYAPRRQAAGLYKAPLGVAAPLTAREEMFTGKLASRYFPGVRRSERAFVTFGNKFRADVFDTLVESWERGGYKLSVMEDKELALFLNRATGRGSLGKLEESAPFLSGLFFSPRLQASRITLVNSLFTGQIPLGSPVRKEAFRTLAAFVGSGVTVLSLLKLSGVADVGVNPNSADFGKIRIGKTRLDIWGGFQQYARFITQVVSGMRTSTITGKTNQVNRMEVVQRFLRSKLMPSVSVLYDLLEGRTYIGEEMRADVEELYERLAPMFVQDMYDAIREEGLVGGFRAVPGVAGVGVVTYKLPNWPEVAPYYALKTTAQRNSYRQTHPDHEAKLFILGQFTTLKTGRARQIVQQLMREHNIDPRDVKGYEKVFGTLELPQTAVPKDRWRTVRGELDSSLLGALNKVWFQNGNLTDEEKRRLQTVHGRNSFGQDNFDIWLKQMLRQEQEKAALVGARV